MITRRLNLNDFEQINELITIRWNQVKKRRPSEHDKTLKDRIKNYLKISKDIENLKDISNLGQAIGCFD